MTHYREGRSRAALDAWWPGAGLAAVGVVVTWWPDPGRRSALWVVGLPVLACGLLAMLLSALGVRKVGRGDFRPTLARWLLVLATAAGSLVLIRAGLREEHDYERKYPVTRAVVTDCRQESFGDDPSYSCVEHVTVNGQVIAERHETDDEYKDDRTVTARVDPVSLHVMSEKSDALAEYVGLGGLLGLFSFGFGWWTCYESQFAWGWMRKRIGRAAETAGEPVEDAVPSSQDLVREGGGDAAGGPVPAQPRQAHGRDQRRHEGDRRRGHHRAAVGPVNRRE
ncbi:hypothetical protein LN042_26460 [Kitasatospora sp. RB6PN24]|uniref:hypothetical protein n=1 Tax=Kitasatospora humi TaxID=2893891 RepID=UPI001E37BE8B|nr:hypothetical protein [Kitasatospora humi]MCC9310571.1 hypothetical protein [Kitasatospora humi]